MTCRRALDVIDAAPFIDRSSTLFATAIDHANQCETCGLALMTATTLTSNLRVLPQLSAPPDLRSAVMTRIARLETGTARARATETPESDRALGRVDWAVWIQLSSLAIALLILPGDWSFLEKLAGARVSPGPQTLVDALIVSSSLALYLVGLTMPLRSNYRLGRITS